MAPDPTLLLLADQNSKQKLGIHGRVGDKGAAGSAMNVSLVGIRQAAASRRGSAQRRTSAGRNEPWRAAAGQAGGLLVGDRSAEEPVGPLLGQWPCLSEVDRTFG